VLEDEVPGKGEQDLLAHLNADLAFEHVGVLVLVAVGVHGRRKRSWPDRVLDEREVVLGIFSADHEPYSHRRQYDASN
jgi:hypothetical protein